jgi:hypothetical protein
VNIYANYAIKKEKIMSTAIASSLGSVDDLLAALPTVREQTVVAWPPASEAAMFERWLDDDDPVEAVIGHDDSSCHVSEAGVPAVSIDLVTTPLEYKRNRLNGSGLVAVGLSDAVLDAVAPALQAVGRACAVQDGRWSLHVEQWSRGG